MSFNLFPIQEHLTVLGESNIVSALTEALSLHVDSVLADKSHTSLTSGDAALTGSLSVILGVGSVKLVGYTSLSHFNILPKEKDGLVKIPRFLKIL